MTGLSSPRAPASRSSNAGDPAVDRRLPLRLLDSSARPRTQPQVTGCRSGSSIPQRRNQLKLCLRLPPRLFDPPAPDTAAGRRLPVRLLYPQLRIWSRAAGCRPGSSIPSTGSSCEPTYNPRVVSGHQSVSKRRWAASKLNLEKKLQRNAFQLRSRTHVEASWIAIVTKTDASVTKNMKRW